ncbi:nucleotidyl transferase domain-containing protein [Gottschalkia acidurici 9a]|uniref:Nucleotidyl transferase domain-containing protein n=1 Tax=Gottschalkia acidurici (strain ATCC 7906 / DSM 604 / BCRC 14475 / CIP 104303 / KCTC 5404 / NCIMB 10678 / 9a) TaxID=1128398 RepID=K0B1X0_GOTA9|nr:nucleotidyltransferase [Gottschalkia acidurici]AFS79112.1 nucleotidyl transferase domain-containing protein [Gottschalkia acidurici 9a]
MKNNLFNKKISEIVEKEKPYGIILVGSLARMSELEIDKARDIDIFVIVDKAEFQREVINVEGLEFDISYMPLNLLQLSMTKRISSVICVLAKSKVLYKSNDTLKEYLDKIKTIYEEGSFTLDDYNINYTRFKLTQSYLTVKSRREDRVNFEFLSGIFIKELLNSYFKLNKIWIPPDKRMLKSIEDRKLIDMIEKYYSGNDKDTHAEDKLDKLESILNHVIEPFGGTLLLWEKGEYPFDFI